MASDNDDQGAAETGQQPPAEVWPMDFHTLGELALMEAKARMTWLIKGWWPHPSYGMAAGMEKTLKSWLDIFENVSVASGLPLFGRFQVVTPGPVVVFTGEGTAGLYWRRLRHVGRSMGMSDAQIAALDIVVCSQRAPITSDRFQASLAMQLERQPAKVSLDPLYSYHGHDVDAGNVHAAAHVLNAFSEPIQEAGASGRIVNHFRKDGGGTLKLVDITQAGGREWVDSWLLVKHRRPPDLDANSYWLRAAVGSRHWGGAAFDLDVRLGGFDFDAFQYTGEATVEVRDAAATETDKASETRTADAMFLRRGDQTAQSFGASMNVSPRQGLRRLDDLVDHGLATSTKVGKERVFSATALEDADEDA